MHLLLKHLLPQPLSPAFWRAAFQVHSNNWRGALKFFGCKNLQCTLFAQQNTLHENICIATTKLIQTLANTQHCSQSTKEETCLNDMTWDNRTGNVLFQWPVEKEDLNPLNCQKHIPPNFIKEWFWYQRPEWQQVQKPWPRFSKYTELLQIHAKLKPWGFTFNFEALWRCPTRKGTRMAILEFPFLFTAGIFP